MQETGASSDSANENAGFENELSLKSFLLKEDKLVVKNLEDDRNKPKDIKKKESKNKRYDPVIQTNRFNNDYEPRNKFLGAGGYGKVLKVTHRFDGNKYAVKIIPIKVKESSLVTEDLGKGQCRVTIQLEENPKLKKFFREANLLTKLDHKNIVRYYDTWLERGFSDSTSSGSSGSYESPSTGSDDVPDESTESGSWIEFRSDVKSSPDLQRKNNVGQNGSGLKSEGVASSGNHGQKIESSGSDNSSESGSSIEVLLYIRVGLCSTDLKKWLWEKRKWNGSELFEMYRDIIRITKEILEGIDYIHAKELIHRDLKPGNIFLEGDIQHPTVKIGDFGISKFIWEDSMEQGLVCVARTAPEHTPTYGTPPYAAPEMSDNHYDCKVDMFSFGVILIDMYIAGITGADKIKIVDQLLNGSECPDVLKQRNKPVALLIEQLIQEKPDKRPTAAQILKDGLFRPESDTTSVNPGAGDATAAEGLQIYGDTANSDLIPIPDMLGLKMKD
jgi:serine/threonine protein kinase